MFRTREPQESLWQPEFLITPRKAVKGGVILGHGAEQKCTTGTSAFSDSVFPNWPAKMMLLDKRRTAIAAASSSSVSA